MRARNPLVRASATLEGSSAWIAIAIATVAVATVMILLALPSSSLAGAPDATGPGRHGGPPAPPGGPPPCSDPGTLIERHAERLGLDDATVAKIRVVVDGSRKRNEKIRRKLDDAHHEMGNLLSADSPDETTVMKQVEKIGALEVEEHKNRLRAMLEIRQMLTPEQRRKLIEIRKEAFAGGGPPPGCRGRGPGRPGPPPHGWGPPPR
jgi:Spy/CpxP family protein refolding chaperone